MDFTKEEVLDDATAVLTAIMEAQIMQNDIETEVPQNNFV